MRRGCRECFPPPLASNETTSYRSWHASRHVRHARAVMHVGIANQRWWEKRSRHSRRMRNPQFCVPGKRPMGPCFTCTQGLYSLSGKTSYRQISLSLEATKLDVMMIVSLWNVTGISMARVACQISERLENFKPESRGFKTAQDLAVRRSST